MRSILAGLRTLVLPWGASASTPRIVIGPNIPTELVNFSPDLRLYGVEIFYYDATTYFWRGMGTVLGSRAYVEGTYDPINGVYITQRVLTPGAGDIQLRTGSYTFNTFQQLLTFQQTKVRFGDGSNINDRVELNGVVVSNSIEFNSSGVGTITEAWQPFTYANGWANNGGSNAQGAYRRVASPPRSVQVVGVFTPGTKANGTAINVAIPAAYRPSKNLDISVSCDNVVAGGQAPHFNVTTAGVLNCWGVTAATNVSVSAIYPLDPP